MSAGGVEDLGLEAELRECRSSTFEQCSGLVEPTLAEAHLAQLPVHERHELGIVSDEGPAALR